MRRRALFLAGLLAAVSCSDAGDPLGPDGRKPPIPEPSDVLQALDCTVTVSSRSVTCTSAQPGTGAASGLIVGGQDMFVKLVSTGMAVVADTFVFNATVQNLLPQALGVNDDGSANAEGVRVFFHAGPNAVGGGGPVVVAGASGSEVFISGNKPYYQYAGALEPNEVSEAKQWKLALNGAPQFNFKVYVSARVKYPQGWVDITPNSALLNVGETAVLADSVFDVVGRGLADNVNWSSSNTGVVTVTETSDSTAQIQGVAQGTAWIKAESQANSVRRDSILVTVNNAPVLNLDSISAVSNVTMPVDSAHGMVANDGTDEKLTVSAGTVSTDRGGTATIAANGSFTYLSKPGYAGLDTIRYTVTDGARTLPGKAVVRVENSPFWFVKQGSGGDGRDASPFGTLAAAQDSAVAGDTIIVFANGVQQLNGAVTLEAGQAIIGGGTSQAVSRGTYNGAAITVLAAGGAAPALTNTGPGATITLGTNNVIRGVGITAAAGAAISGTSFGTLFVRETGVNPAGPALLLSTGALDAIFDVLSSTGSTTTGLSLTDVTGSLAATGGAIASSVGTAFHVSGGSADITYGGSITNGSGLAASISGRTGGALAVSGDVTDSAGGISVSGISGGTVGFSGALSLTGSGVSVGSNTGGTISFTGASKTITTGSNAGVSLTSNTGAAVTFGGGGLDVTTTSGAGFTASGGGTVSVTGANNTVESTTGTAVTLNGVGTGASGVNFLSVSANGAANGIALASVTGAGLQVTGDGSNGGSGGTVQNTTSHAVSLSSMTGADSVSLKFMAVGGGNAGTAGIFGSGFGTLRVTGVSVATTGGPALSLATGTLNGGFSSLGSASSASNGVILTSTGGSFTAAAGSITGAASTAFAVAGGSVSATLSGSISQANNAPLVAVSGSHNGALTFNTGTVGATNGTGLQFNNAVGTYAFNGTTTLNGGDAAIDITNSSTGSFTFGTGASVTNPTGSAFTVYGSSPTVTYSGNLTKGNAGLLVDIGEQPAGSVTFNTGTLSATAGTGISLSNADGTVAFNGTTTLNGGDAGVDVVSGSNGAISFGAGASIANASGIALRVQNGSASTNVSYAGSVTSSATGLAVHVEGVSGGSVTASGAISGTNGILVQNNTGGTITFSGASKVLNTTVNPAVTATNNTGSTLVFSGGNLGITTTTGAGFTASGGGTVQVTGANNTIATTSGTALSLSSVATGASGVNLASVSANGAVNGILLSNLTAGPGVQVNGGTIQGTTGAGVSLANLSSLTTGVNLSGMTLSRTAGTGAVITGTTFGTLTIGSTSVSATGGPGALNLNTGTLNGTIASINASGTGAATHAVSLASVGGTYTVGGGTMTGSANGDALNVSGGNAVATWTAPTLTSASTATQAVDISNTTGGSYTFATVSAPNTSGGVRMVTNAGSVTFAGLTLGNSGARYTFTPLALQMGSGNISLGAVSIFTQSSTALAMTSAAGSGTLSISSGTLNAASGAAVNIAPSAGTQPLAISLTSVTATSSTNGIRLAGTNGSFAVLGTGTASSGGTIQSMSGNGIHLATATNVSLASMLVTANNGSGVFGDQLTNFTLTGSQVTNNDADHPTGTNESGLFFNTLLGSNTIRSTTVSGTNGDGVRWEANGGAQGTLRVVKSTLGPNPVGTGGNGFAVVAINDASVTAVVDSSVVSGNQTAGFLTSFANTATYNVSVKFTKFSGNNIGLDHGIGGGNGTFTFQHDTLVNHRTAAVNVISDAASTGTTKANGNISNNVIGTGTAGSGTTNGNGIGVDIRGGAQAAITIQNNLVQNTLMYPMIIENRLGTGRSDFIVSSNTFNPAEDPFTPFEGVRVTSRDSRTTCLNMAANTSTGSMGAAGIRTRQANSAVFQLDAFAGVGTNSTSINDYLDSPRNTATSAVVTAGTGTVVNYTSATCQTAAF
ncbi:MAG TPA: Ig-like domain-containing protein [Longimicrobium sp.]